MPSHDIPYNKPGLRKLIDGVKGTLVPGKRARVEAVKGDTELYSYPWDYNKHTQFVQDVLRFEDPTMIDTLVESDNPNSLGPAQRHTISYYIRKNMERSGLRSPKGSGRYHPCLFWLNSGTQWIQKEQMAVIVLIEMHERVSAKDDSAKDDSTKVDSAKVDPAKVDSAKVDPPEAKILSPDGEWSVTVPLTVGCVILLYGPHGWRSETQAMSFLFLYYDIVKDADGANSAS
ncbi:hypothetical protein CORC01_10827 [Colletotrichum orchidophilum]|uniref:Uncharacterized protein n=1 Tax=Colletotrichum orchidophilum TaxID=1209926 RepID=A0A1G4AXN8_9PEZI|nr:uncharacterized protein CORC01_10827 [Colletotrichum orchidophilum]OHE93928.1 hypothetical protein CORC01_10827 [Colletotrichum orchidophilum]